MSYVSQSNTQTRALSAVAVAVIQGGVLLLLVKGLAGVIALPVAPPNPQATDVPITVPISPPDNPVVHPPVGARGPSTATTLTAGPTPTDFGPISQLIDAVLPGGDGGKIEVPHTATHLARAAQPVGGAWASAADYPTIDLRLGHQGTTRYLLSVSPAGGVTSCTITGSSGWPGLDEATCRLARQRARFGPALDDGGSATAGSYAGSVSWRIPVE
jgi:protein TonB